MATNRTAIIAILVLFISIINIQAQTSAASQPAAVSSVTATVTSQGTVRMIAHSEALQIRMEIYSATGEIVSDSGLRLGNILDWKQTDATQAMPDGAYLVVVTVKDFKGNLNQRMATLSLQAGQFTLQNHKREDVTRAQTQALETSRQGKKVIVPEGDDSVSVLRDGKERAVLVTGHNGTDGVVNSTSGALTLGTGNVFSDQDQEQMRITPEGRVGIGTKTPEATLDVAGTIKARGGIQFADGTVLNSAGGFKSNTSLVATTNLTSGTTEAALAGTGTANKISKWIDGTGTLGDSSLYEDGSGNIGIGTSTPGGVFDLQRNSSGDLVQRFWNTGTGGAKLRYVAGVGGTSQIQLTDADEWLMSIAGNNQSGLQFRVRAQGALNNEATLNASPRMTIARNGNVGIGTTTPAQRLEVAGSLKLSGAGSALIFPDGSSMTTAPVGGAGTPTGSSIITAINDPATTGAISEARLSPNVAKLNGQNNWTGQNTFNGLSMNGTNIVNLANPVSATDATNKAYVDANFIKFVPGAEQLSVGDANGTAPMINLRGGSTCCSGPGGHTPAFFKVFQNGSFVATGNLGIGVSPMEGKGYRTSWHTYKGAFRSGYADNEWDDVNVGFFSWAGGSNSTASGLYALSFGDTNFAESTSSIVFGSGNQVKGAAGFSAGAGNRVCDTYGVALGNNAKSGGPYINGKCDPETFNIRGLAAVAIGYNVTADQDHSTAMGKFASNNGFQGTFIWSDGSAQASADTFRNTANNEFAARATGGFRFRTNLGGTTGCNLPAGSGVFNCTSSRTTKENFTLVNGADVLSRLRGIEVSTWNYIAEGSKVRHMGPMAEDFYKAFQLGTGNTSIGMQDLSGVSLAAIKELDQRTDELKQKTAEVEQLREQVNQLRQENSEMERRLATLEQLMLGQLQQTSTSKGN